MGMRRAQVRAAVPMYLLARKIKAGGFKVVLSGEGADEAYGGYLYFHKAPRPAEFQQCARAPPPCTPFSSQPFPYLHHSHTCITALESAWLTQASRMALCQ